MFEPIEETKDTPLHFLVCVIGLAAGLYWSGWVFAALWEWFVSPIISLRHISVPEAIGLIVTLGLLLGRSNQDKKQDLTWDIIQDRAINWLMRPLVALTVGAIVNAFV